MAFQVFQSSVQGDGDGVLCWSYAYLCGLKEERNLALMCCITNLLKYLITNGVSAMGQWVCSCWNPLHLFFGGIVMIAADFGQVGMEAWSREMLKIFVKIPASWSTTLLVPCCAHVGTGCFPVVYSQHASHLLLLQGECVVVVEGRWGRRGGRCSIRCHLKPCKEGV